MKTEKNILIAFLLNLSFSVLELLGGLLTNSIAILSDAIHDFGDALSIGISFFLEKKSKKKPDDIYTYGYMRYSILGAFITTTILLVGSILVIIGGIKRIIVPETINYNGMIWFAIFGVVINFIAAYYTREGDSLNQKSVNLHMLEDVLGWIVVLIGSILMKFTDINFIDSLMSIGVSSYILFHAIHNFKEGIDLFLEKIPKDISIEEIKHHLMEIPGVLQVHHIHLWTLDGNNNYATMHIRTNQEDIKSLKQNIRSELKEHNIDHVTIEIERENEICEYPECTFSEVKHVHHHH